MKFQCPKCGYTSNRKSSYINHINKTNICYASLSDVEPTLDNMIIINETYMCNICEKKYANYQYYLKHIYICEEKKEKEKKEKEQLILQQLKIVTEQLDELKKTTLNITNNNTVNDNSINTNTNNTINNNNNITLLGYKTPDLSHMTDQMMNMCIGKGINTIPTYIKNVHFNSEKPENHNMYISNMRTKYVHVHDGEQWNIADRGIFIKELINRYDFKIQTWAENPDMRKKYPNAINDMETYQKLIDEAQDKIEAQISIEMYNRRNMVIKE